MDILIMISLIRDILNRQSWKISLDLLCALKRCQDRSIARRALPHAHKGRKKKEESISIMHYHT